MLYLNLFFFYLISHFIHYFCFIFFWCECSNRNNIGFLTHILGIGDIGPEGGFLWAIVCCSRTECWVWLDLLWSGDIFFLENCLVCVVVFYEFVEVDKVFFGEVEDGIVIA